MEKQKLIQKEWYDHKIPLKKNEVSQISTLTHIQRLKDLFPVQKTKLSLNCGCGMGGRNDIFGPSRKKKHFNGNQGKNLNSHSCI